MKTDPKRDLIGASVRLLREIRTNGGQTFANGTLMKIESVHGGLTLSQPDEPGRWSGRFIRFVPRDAIEILP